MGENKDKHSSDLEWMLLSRQVDDEVIVDHLVREYYPQIFQLAASRLVYPRRAQHAAQEVITRAVLGSKKYPPDKTVDAWLRDITEEVVSKQSSYLSQQHLLNSKLISTMRKHKPVESLEAVELDQVKEHILIALRHNSASGLKKAQYQELLLVVLTLLIFVIVLQYRTVFPASLNDPFQAEDIDTPLNQRTGLFSNNLEKKMSSSYYDVRKLPDWAPLTIDSTHEDIWRQVLMSRYTWSSFWADVSVILHGPAEYIGPPLVERHQLWLSAEQEGLHISGDPGGEEIKLERVTTTNNGPGLLSLLHGYDDYSRLGSQVPWFYLSSESIIATPYMANFFFLADYDFPPHRLKFRAVEESTWANRPVLVVHATNAEGNLQAVLWLDAETGLALREQFFSSNSRDHVRLETIVERVEFNPVIPEGLLEEIFSGNQAAAFASDYSGQPEDPTDQPGLSIWEAQSSQALPPAMLPPGDFEPDQSRLTFVFPGTRNDKPGQDSVLLYADQYLLGDIFLDDPWHSICARSPAGSQIVISHWSQPPENLASTVAWYELSDMRSKIIQVPGVTITRLAFSPDAAYIAAAGVKQRNGASQLYLIHTDTGKIESIRGFNNVWSIAWSPDGTRIAGLSLPSFRVYTSWKLRVVTYDLESQTIRTRLVNDDFSWGYSSVQIPLPEWTATFPLSMHGLEPCAEPPGAFGAD